MYFKYINVMRLKSELYKKEQDEILDKIITILDLENKNTYTLYELDNNEEYTKANHGTYTRNKKMVFI